MDYSSFFDDLPVFPRIAEEMLEFYRSGALDADSHIGFNLYDGKCQFELAETSEDLRHIVAEVNLKEGLSCETIKYHFGLALAGVLKGCRDRHFGWADDAINKFADDPASTWLAEAGLPGSYDKGTVFVENVALIWDGAIASHETVSAATEQASIAAKLYAEAIGADDAMSLDVISTNALTMSGVVSGPGGTREFPLEGSFFSSTFDTSKPVSLTVVDGLKHEVLGTVTPIAGLNEFGPTTFMAMWRNEEIESSIGKGIYESFGMNVTSAEAFSKIALAGAVEGKTYWVTAPLSNVDLFLLAAQKNGSQVPAELWHFIRRPTISK